MKARKEGTSLTEKNKKGEKGFTLLEVIMAISILTVGLLAVASMQISAMRGNSFSQDVTESTDIAQDVTEKLYAISFNSTALNNGPHDESELVGLDTSDKYTVTWTVQVDTPVSGVKTIQVTVQYNDRGNTKTHIFEFMRSEI